MSIRSVRFDAVYNQYETEKCASLIRFTQILHTLRVSVVGTHDEAAEAGFSVLTREQ